MACLIWGVRNRLHLLSKSILTDIFFKNYPQNTLYAIAFICVRCFSFYTSTKYFFIIETRALSRKTKWKEKKRRGSETKVERGDRNRERESGRETQAQKAERERALETRGEEKQRTMSTDRRASPPSRRSERFTSPFFNSSATESTQIKSTL